MGTAMGRKKATLTFEAVSVGDILVKSVNSLDSRENIQKRIISPEESHEIKIVQPLVCTCCVCCGSEFTVPFWTAKLWNHQYPRSLTKTCRKEKEKGLLNAYSSGYNKKY